MLSLQYHILTLHTIASTVRDLQGTPKDSQGTPKGHRCTPKGTARDSQGFPLNPQWTLRVTPKTSLVGPSSCPCTSTAKRFLLSKWQNAMQNQWPKRPLRVEVFWGLPRDPPGTFKGLPRDPRGFPGDPNGPPMDP
jgi:hypothetical protein